MSFSGSPKGTPHDWCRRTMKKNYPEPQKCSICWVSHMFSIREYRYSYGICFGTVYALQNSTPNISTPNILSIFFSVHTRRVEIGHILSRRSWLYMYMYMHMYMYMYMCMYMYMYMYMCMCMCMCMCICVYVCMYVCYVCMYACMHGCMDACMHVCMYACMHVCMYVCTYVRM